jgi:Trk K+ transport system NAD-binding subunit
MYGMSHTGLRIASCLRESGAQVVAAVRQGSEFLSRLERLEIAVTAGDLQDFSLLQSLEPAKARSIILPSEDELFNLNAALHAVEMNPAIRVIIRLFNMNLAKKLEASIRNLTVLSASQIASSVFATSALIENPVLSFETGEEILNIYRMSGDGMPGKSIEQIEREQELKILSVNEDLFPLPERSIAATDLLTVFSRFKTASALCGVHACGSHAGVSREGNGARDFFNSLRQLDRVLLRTVAALLVVVTAAVLFFHAAERLSLLDAGYFVVTVLTTTGFGDISLKDSAALSKVAGMALMLTGMALMAMLFAIISDNLLKKRLELFLGRRRIRLRNHVVLCGIGDVGIRILEDLVRIGESVAVVEKNPDGKFTDWVRQRNIPLIISDASQEESLLNANIGQAKAIICATDNDMRNLEIGLNAKGIQPGIRAVLRIFEKEFAEKVERHFGINVAISSSSIAAPAFMSAALNTGIINFVDVSGRRLLLKESVLSVSEDLRTLMERKGTKVLMLVRPDGKTVLRDIENCIDPGSKIVYLADSTS